MKINDDVMEALANQQAMEQEIELEKRYLVKEMMQESYTNFFEDNGDGDADPRTDEQAEKHYWDAKHGL